MSAVTIVGQGFGGVGIVEFDRLGQQSAHPDPAHPDPESPGYAPPDPASLSTVWRKALISPEMAAYRETLLLPGHATVRASILDDLSTYYHLPPEECVRRCLHWEQWSVQEWQARPRTSAGAIAEFYNTVQSWSFDLLWYAYLQAEGALYPASVVAATVLERSSRRLRSLDFGSGVGDLAHALLKLGHDVVLADVSRPLLDFARWRLERRSQPVACIDLNEAPLPKQAYDVVLAKDVLVHVPSFSETVTALHDALRPDGLLLATFDTRPPSPENAWHLYADDVSLRRTLQDRGFEQVERLDQFLFVYRRVEPAGLPHLARRVRNAIVLSQARHLVRRGKAWANQLLAQRRAPTGT